MNQKKKPKISFLFNQLLTKELRTGGEVRGKVIATAFKKSRQFSTTVIVPEISSPSFPNYDKIIIGHQQIEKKINRETAFSALILYIVRTLQTIKHQSQIKPNILYSTGDFFCNIIPSVIIKKNRPNTKLAVVIHHINQNPLHRRHSSFIISSISYLLQQLSLNLIKNNFDIVFVVNQQVKKYLKEDKKFSQKIIVSGNGLDLKQINQDIKLAGNIKAKNHICYFGRVSATKGSLDLPKILKQIRQDIPSIHLDIIGSVSPDIQQTLLNDFLKNDCQKNYTLHGFIPQKKDIFKIMLQSKVVLFPSYEEGWGISLFEAAMLQRPIVAYNLSIFQELFQNKLITAPIGNTRIFSQKVIKLLKNNRSTETKKYIKYCYHIANKYDWHNVFIKEKEYLIKQTKQ